MKVKCFLIFRASTQEVRTVKRMPRLEWDEIAWNVELTVPQPWAKLAGTIELEIPEGPAPTVRVHEAERPSET